MDASILIGSAFSTADDKSHSAAPAQWCQLLSNDSSSQATVVMSAHECSPCATIYGANYLGRIMEEVEPDSQEAVHIRRFSLVETINYASGGCLALPKSIATYTDITNWIMFVGAALHAQMWEPERLAKNTEAYAPRWAMRRSTFWKGKSHDQDE